MGEILVALGISIWLSAAGIFAYRYLKTEYKDFLDSENKLNENKEAQ